MFLSYLMSNLNEWHRATPTVPPVGAVNVPPKIRKIQKIHEEKKQQKLQFSLILRFTIPKPMNCCLYRYCRPCPNQ